jgi:uracil-DNA glycosylase
MWQELEPINTILLDRLYKKGNVLPPKEDVFKVFDYVCLSEVKIIVISQDPYPTIGDAHGIAFSTLNPKPPKSLVNIFNKLKEYNPDVKLKSNNLTEWVKQGIFLYNTSLTIEPGKIGHFLHWKNFTNLVLSLLNQQDRPILWVLMGNHAIEFEHIITNPKHEILRTTHPSPLGYKKVHTRNDVLTFNKINIFKIMDEFDRKHYKQHIPISWNTY